MKNHLIKRRIGWFGKNRYLPMSNRRGQWIYQRLKWLHALFILLPLLFLGILELVQYWYLEEAMSRATQRLTVVVTMFSGVIVFSTFVMGIIYRLQRTAETQRAQLKSQNEMGLELSAQHQLDDILSTVIRFARNSTGAPYGAVLLRTDSDANGFMLFENGLKGRAIHMVAVNHSVLSTIVNDGRAMLIEELHSYPPFEDLQDKYTGMIGVPIINHAEVIGALYLCNVADKFTGEDLSLLSLLATHSGVAIDNARLYESLQRLTLLEERQRIAMDLHDGAIQSLYALGLHLELLRDRASGDPNGHINVDGAVAQIGVAISEINGVIKEIRDYITELNESDVSQGTITQSLQREIIRLRAHGIDQVEMEYNHELTEEEDADLSVLDRAVHECVSNIIKHSGASAVRFSINRNAERFVVMVKDNGVGVASPNDKADYYGQKNMAARLSSLGGTLRFDSPPGDGYCVTMEVPRSAFAGDKTSPIPIAVHP